MQLAADNNMQVVQPTSASQIFHLLRRQQLRMFRKPLIIMTPKSLLRNKDATSPITEFTKGEFKTVIGERDTAIEAAKVKRVIACSGKVYYDLVKSRAERKGADVAIIRVEQLYPFPHKAFAAELKKYPHLSEIVWCQDEPQNQGAGIGFAGGGLFASAPGAAEVAARSGIRQAQGFHPDQVSVTRRIVMGVPC